MNTQQKIITLYEQDQSLTSSKICEIVGCSRHMVESAFRKCGIKRRNSVPNNKIFLTKPVIQEMITMYNNGNSCNKISKTFGISVSTVNINLSENGVIMRDRFKCHNIFKVKNIFKKIDNELSAYFLGIMYADGCVSSSRNTISINLIESEKNILEKLSLEILGVVNLYKGKKKLDHHTQNYILSVNDASVRESLISHGCGPKKSLTLTFPSDEMIPKRLLSHFVRGYFDGDGGVSSLDNSLCIVGSAPFINGLSVLLKNQDIKNSIYSHGKIKKLYLFGSFYIRKFRDYIYQSAQLFSIRKRTRIDEISDKCPDYLLRRYIATMPNGEEIITDNLLEFCRDHNLWTGDCFRIANGDRESTKDIKIRYAEDSKQRFLPKCRKKSFFYKIINLSDNSEINIDSLLEYCNVNNLSYDTVRKCMYRNKPYKNFLIQKLKRD